MRASTVGLAILISQRPRLGFAIPNDATGDQIRIVQYRAKGIEQGIAQLSAFVDRPRCFRGCVTGNAARKRELAK